MKKSLIALLLVLTMVLCLAACASAGEEEEDYKSKDTSGESLAEKEKLNLEDEDTEPEKKPEKEPVLVVDPANVTPTDPTANPGTGTTGPEVTTTTPPIEQATGVQVDYYGKINIYEVNVRSSPKTGDVVTTLKDGALVHVTEERKDSDGNTWGKIEKGWVSLKYVTETSAPPSANTDPTQPAEPQEKKTGVINIYEVNVRDEPSGNIITTLKKGERVVIVETRDANTYTWGKLEGGGWIAMKYVDLDG